MTAVIRLVRLPEHGQRRVPNALFDRLACPSRPCSVEVLGPQDLTTSSQESSAGGTHADSLRVRGVAIAAWREGRGLANLLLADAEAAAAVWNCPVFHRWIERRQWLKVGSPQTDSGVGARAPGTWDSERVLLQEAPAQWWDRDWVTTAVRSMGAGLRSHGLAGGMKRVNSLQHLAGHPPVHRILPWTQKDNIAVIALNKRFGFPPVAMDLCWEQTVGGAA